MAAVTTLAVTTAATAYSINEQRSARKDQERAQADAARQGQLSAAEQDRVDQEKIRFALEQQDNAMRAIRDGYFNSSSVLNNPNLDVTRDIAPFQDATAGIDAYKRLISGGQMSGPMSDFVSNASVAATSNPALMTDGDIVQNEIARLGSIEGQKLQPMMEQSLLSQGQVGLGALSDVANANARQLEQNAQLRENYAQSMASALTGNAPELAQLSNAANSSRSLNEQAGMLSNIASQNIGNADKEAVAQGIGYLAGQLGQLG